MIGGGKNDKPFRRVSRFWLRKRGRGDSRDCGLYPGTRGREGIPRYFSVGEGRGKISTNKNGRGKGYEDRKRDDYASLF